MKRWWLLFIAASVVLALVVTGSARPTEAAPARVNGSGSTYVALAMQQWVADAQTSGLQVNYLPTGSPDGLTSYGNALIDFAGTEAEFSALTGGAGGSTPGDARGYQYIPDVAGAIAVMYNAEDKAGRKIDYLHLSTNTIARIFTGDISNWSDPAISADNKGLELPNEPITVVYRSGQSGTTALFYDFVQHVNPDLFSAWAGRNQLPTNVRIIQLDSSPGFAPKTLALNGSDQIAQYVAGGSGKWSIAYDEFGYAKTYGAPAAWVQNASGAFVQPYAENISAALKSAQLRADLSQELSGVYASGDPLAYPISAYSYVVTQCAGADRQTCKGAYLNGGITETMAKWLRYIACEGQVNMARIGYSPLPTNLSQEIVNSITRMQGSGTPEQLSQGNCANPTFAGSLGAGSSSPDDPLTGVASLSGNGGQADAAANGDAAAQQAAASGGAAAGAGSGKAGSAIKSVGGGSTDYRDARPVAYTRPGLPGTTSTLLLVFLAVVAIPPLVAGFLRRRKARQPPSAT